MRRRWKKGRKKREGIRTKERKREKANRGMRGGGSYDLVSSHGDFCCTQYACPYYLS